jgi:hypothetical protein
MQCHYCDEAADITVEKSGVSVGLCERHFRERLAELEDVDWLGGLDDEIDVDRK